MLGPLRIFISCEHAGNRVPEDYRHLFAGREALLETHRGYDIGIAAFARRLAAEFRSPLLLADTTRLLIDHNRPLDSRTLFSEFTRSLPRVKRAEIIRRYHRPYWLTATDIVAGIIAAGQRVLHLSVHSFTPVLNGKVRNADIGLLYDPSRAVEKRICLQWQRQLTKRQPELRIRRNYPYRGNAAALVTALRKTFKEGKYLGIELEVNQRIPVEQVGWWDKLQNDLLLTLGYILKNDLPEK